MCEKCVRAVFYYAFDLFTIKPKTRPQAIKHYTSKVDYIQSNLNTIEETVQKKREYLNCIVNVMQSKIQSQAGGKS
jgi:prefoldin alpha subunit